MRGSSAPKDTDRALSKLIVLLAAETFPKEMRIVL
jgi:hypothetical protein